MLQAAGVDLAALRDEIAARYGLTIDLRTLAALAQDGRVHRPDIEVLEAVALILGVRVDDLLDVRAMEPAEAVSASDDVLLDAERDARLRDLTELRDRGDRLLTEAEVRELETLIAQAGRAPSARACPSAQGGYGDYGVGVEVAAASGVSTATAVVASASVSASASGVSTATAVVLAAASGVAAACGASCRRCPPRWRPWTEAWCTLSCFPVPPGRPWAEAAAGRTRAAASTATANERRERVMVMWVILFPFRFVLPVGPVQCGPWHLQ
jgi:transcriptional regulator with XRE-family HTH domain